MNAKIGSCQEFFFMQKIICKKSKKELFVKTCKYKQSMFQHHMEYQKKMKFFVDNLIPIWYINGATEKVSNKS